MNENRVAYAKLALDAFTAAAWSDEDEALTDLLANLKIEGLLQQLLLAEVFGEGLLDRSAHDSRHDEGRDGGKLESAMDGHGIRIPSGR